MHDLDMANDQERGSTESDDGHEGSASPNSIKEMLMDLSAHGIHNIIGATSTKRRAIWSVLFLIAVGSFIGLTTVLIWKYCQYDVVVNLDILYEPTIDFPAVTVCNMNPYRRSNVRNFSRDLYYVLGLNSTSSPSVTYQNWDYTSIDSQTQTAYEAVQIVGNSSYEQRFEVGYELTDMLLRCTFQRKNCGPANFTRFYNYQYGNCYTFNTGTWGAELEIFRTGSMDGLMLEMYVEQDEYVATIQPAAGLRVLIHDQREMPFPENEGINLVPGMETSIGMSKVGISHLGSPYTNCTEDFGEGNIFREKFPHIIYSRTACEKNCVNNIVVEQCGCADPQYRYNDTIQTCDQEDYDCFESVNQQYISGLFSCGCAMPCSQIDYRYTMSEALWPNDEHRPAVQAGIESISADMKAKAENSSDFIEKNLVKVNIYFSTLEYESIYEADAYDLFDLISDLGAQVGLWLGASILTISEFFELFYHLFKICLKKIGGPISKKARREVPSEEEEEDAHEMRSKSG